MQAEDSVIITAYKDSISNLISIQIRFVKGFVLPPVAYYPFRQHVKVSGYLFSLLQCFRRHILFIITLPPIKLHFLLIAT